jgi:hypothetical protein
MSDMIVIDAEVGEDRKLVVQLPPDAPQGQVRVTVEKITPHDQPELTPEEEVALDAEFEALINDPKTFTGLGLTAEEIAKAPEICSWAHRTDIADSAEFVENMRRNSRLRRQRRED